MAASAMGSPNAAGQAPLEPQSINRVQEKNLVGVQGLEPWTR
jgi:hypothetical protein